MNTGGWASTALRRKAVRSIACARVGVRIGVLLAGIMLVQTAVAQGLSGGYGHGETVGNAPVLLSALATDSAVECNRLEHKADLLSHGGSDQQGYDTTRYYLEHCFEQLLSYTDFSLADADNFSRSSDSVRFPEYREWLKSVLYLRSDSTWYCRDVESITGTFAYFEGHGYFPNGSIAVERYVLSSRKCDSSLFSHGLYGDSVMRYRIWRDTVKDSLHEPRPDTTIPSLEDIGLSILRGPKQAVPPSALPPGADHLALLRMSEDPFERSTELIFTVADYGLVTFELFDVLGHRVSSNGIGQVLDPGEHRITITGDGLASGVYFARLTYHDGDVHSIMVRKR